LIADGAGSLYGATIQGGNSNCSAGCGTIVGLSSPAAGATKWTETVLYRFRGDLDGQAPWAGLIADGTGNLYTTTVEGGGRRASCRTGCGTIVKLSPPAAGAKNWTETVLYRFQGGADGASPNAGLIADSAGNLYTRTVYGGAGSSGTIVKLAPPPAGQSTWTETVLYSFQGGTYVGFPDADLIADSAGSLYTTSSGGNGTACGPGGCGIILKLSPPAAGQSAWTETTLYNFQGGTDGDAPDAGLIADSVGNLYTTTAGGGAHGYGTAVELSGSGFAVGKAVGK
jgi:hypothetical protein